MPVIQSSTTTRFNKEELFLKILQQEGVLVGVGDDGVALYASKSPKRVMSRFGVRHQSPIIVASDGFCEHTHFERHWLSLSQIAHKAMLVNISDMVAMNAQPKYALLSITLPTLSPYEVVEIAKALAQSAHRYNIQFIGGDTMSNENLAFHCTLIGTPRGKVLSRKGVLRGDLVFCTGRVGQSAYALKWLLNGGMISTSKRFARFVAPILRGDFIARIASFVHSGLDVSDGVFAELKRLGTINRVRFYIAHKKRMNAYQSGEEYEMLFSIAPRDKCRLLRLARSMRIPLEYIGRAGRRGQNLTPKVWH